MLKTNDGNIYRLRKPNPLMEAQGIPWEDSELVFYNLDGIGTLDIPRSEPGSANLEKIGEESMLRNQDGTPYQLEGNLKTFDTENVDQDLIHSVDQEAIELSGSPIFYYKVFIDESNYDDLYMESRNKIRVQDGIELYAQWEPVTPTNDMGVFGIDSPDEVTFNFNIRDFREKVGDDIPKVGALIYTPFDKNWWEIIQYNHGVEDGDFKLWGKYRFAVLARKYQESMTDEEPTRPKPNSSAQDIVIR